MKIKKAVIPCAGIGSRFLPWTKVMPKEMLPIIDKPVIHYIVEECVRAGIEQIVIVTDSRKRAIEDYFDNSLELEIQLQRMGKIDKIDKIKNIPRMAEFIYVRQKGPYGNATPVKEVKNVIGNEPFVVLWGDQFIWAEPSRLEQCLAVYEKYCEATFAALKVDDEQKKSCGVGRVEKIDNNIYELKEIVEKPGPEGAPSDLMVSGVYIFNPDIFPILDKLEPGKEGEYWLVDAINQLCKKTKCKAVEIKGGRFQDTGNKLAYHKTIIDFMLEDKEIGEKIREYIEIKLNRN